MTSPLKGNWHYPTAIRFGAARIQEIASCCDAQGIQTPLFVTDPGLADFDMTQATIAILKDAGLKPVIFTDLKPNPTGENITAGVNAYRLQHCDGVIGFGGGSALDSAKTIALMANQNCHLWDLEDQGNNFKRADSAKIPPIIAVPTTAGTGSEVGRAALIVDTKAHTKKIIFHPKMLASIVILDPELTQALPPKLTAATGMDALAHNLEAYCAPGFHPMADGIALEGMRLIKQYLPRAYANGQDLEARAYCLAAATMGATAFQKGLGAIHSLSHPVGAIYDAHHGLLNAIFMPYVLEFNLPAIESRLDDLGYALKIGNARDVIAWTRTLIAALDIPATLKAIGIDTTQADEIAQLAMQDGSTPSNPLPLSVSHLKTIFINTVNGVCL